MQETITIQDVFSILIELERSGAKHYEAMAAISEEGPVRTLFQKLKEQEVIHEGIYRHHLTEIESIMFQETDQDYTNYLKGLIVQTFKMLSTLHETPNDQVGAFKALDLEKETLFFLSELKLMLPASHTHWIEVIQGEERKHVTWILNYLNP